ncbi:hypothetical protein L211DRAFT_254524 [Terfezia boudieri ATCC MYA-4762]|uniref:Uncharacterized protein n=1 Tax=Terfezia boudieri ATCC MYA-4762 TaxID=1051890 RepID=A0A3N4M1L9_9PEZI|nr:hypothetical protein L211DRAFT_254524 [Terfezia boudieri ATCC MYA-4762]
MVIDSFSAMVMDSLNTLCCFSIKPSRICICILKHLHHTPSANSAKYNKGRNRSMGDLGQGRGRIRARLQRRHRAQTPSSEHTREAQLQRRSGRVGHESGGNGGGDDDGDDDDDGRELPAETFSVGKGKKGDRDPSPQSVRRSRQRELRHQPSSENLLSFMNPNKSDYELVVEVERRELNTMTHTKKVSKGNGLSTGQERREMNTVSLTDSLYNDLSKQEQCILNEHITQSSLPQMKTHIATDIRTRIILWEMKEPLKKVPIGYAHANGNIIPSQGDQGELWATERHLQIQREQWIKERVNSVRLSTMLERTEEEENVEAMGRISSLR